MHRSFLARRLKLPMNTRVLTLPLASLVMFSHAASANLPPTISGMPAASVNVGSQYVFAPAASDPEGKTLVFVILNKPSWASFHTKTGRLSGTPSSTGVWNGIKIIASDGVNASVIPSFSIRAVPSSNVSPSITGTPPTSAKAYVAYHFQPVAHDPNGDSLSFSIANRPAWASFDASTGRLSGTPGSAHVGAYNNIVIGVSDGSNTAALPAFSISVANASQTNRPPAIAGTPPTTATVGRPYSFRAYAGDADGDSLAYSIQNKPQWANFNTARGILEGTPVANGTHTNILISVSDGRATTSLRTFTITVSGGAPANTPPVIGGTPMNWVNSSAAYTFRPTASDADGDALTFSIANRPAWASFDAQTGQLSGTPNSSHAGSYANIVISVSDGTANTALPAFSINVMQAQPRTAELSWTAPTSNTDGSALTNLAGYRIHYGASANLLSQTIQVANAGLTAYVVENLSPGTYYFAIRAYTNDGTESEASNIVSKTVQ